MARESTAALIKRALNCQCPVCGRGAVFRTHFKMNRECPRCHVVFWKDPGESLGAMYIDYAVASVAFLVCWGLLAFTKISDTLQILILCTVAAGSVLLCYPLTRSAWIVLVYPSGGIEVPQLRAVRGGKRAP